ncbi:melanocyte-stimulating hormone receptor-like [Oculina patagonica]
MGNISHPETIVIINCVLNATLMIISIIGNTLVLAAILRTPSLRSPSMFLLSSLAVSDLLVGLVVQPVFIAYQLTKTGSVYKTLTTTTVCGASLSTITAISADRFLALHYHMRYPDLITTKRAIYTLAVLWFLSFLLSLFSFWKMDAYYLAMGCGMSICLLISTVCYIQIYRIVRHHQLQIHAQQQAVENLSTENNQHIQRSTKCAKSTFIYYTVMIMCYTPFVVTILFIPPRQWTSAWYFTDTIAFMNSSINPFLYCWRLRELRTAVVKTARQMLWKQIEDN